jgi:hypothetical protein
MRVLSVLALLVACSPASVIPGAGPSKPAVTPMLSELPADPGKRDAVLDGAHYQPGPEQHGKVTPKERKAETIGATAAAIIGSMFSTTQNTTIGVESILDPITPIVPRTGRTETDKDKKSEPLENVKSDELVPWVKLKPKPAGSGSASEGDGR